MPVYVDRARNGYGRMVMCHMIADTPAELHAMADRIGVARRWFQQPPKASFWHYDIAQTRRTLAIAAGAIDCERNDFVAAVRRIRASQAFLPRCQTCQGRGWIDEDCESAIAGMSVPSRYRPICDDCDGTGFYRSAVGGFRR